VLSVQMACYSSPLIYTTISLLLLVSLQL